MAQITEQWRRYGLAEGMRKQADPDGARGSSTAHVPEEPETNRLVKRVQQLERVVDIQAAMVKELVSRIDRLERGTAGSSSSSFDRDPAGRPSPARRAWPWTWLPTRLRRVH